MSSSARALKAQKLATRLVLTAPKPRNPLVALAAQRKAGSHTKSNKANRASDAAQLKRDLGAL